MQKKNKTPAETQAEILGLEEEIHQVRITLRRLLARVEKIRNETLRSAEFLSNSDYDNDFQKGKKIAEFFRGIISAWADTMLEVTTEFIKNLPDECGKNIVEAIEAIEQKSQDERLLNVEIKLDKVLEMLRNNKDT